MLPILELIGELRLPVYSFNISMATNSQKYFKYYNYHHVYIIQVLETVHQQGHVLHVLSLSSL